VRDSPLRQSSIHPRVMLIFLTNPLPRRVALGSTSHRAIDALEPSWEAGRIVPRPLYLHHPCKIEPALCPGVSVGDRLTCRAGSGEFPKSVGNRIEADGGNQEFRLRKFAEVGLCRLRMAAVELQFSATCLPRLRSRRCKIEPAGL